MRLLILGGTVFLGRHLAAGALAAGHAVTLFTRGRHKPELFPQAVRLRGDRDGDLTALDGQTWDAVIDTSGYLPRVVRASARRLAGSAGLYAFVSSISVYADLSRPGVDEEGPLARLEDPATESIDGETYGGLKALCEAACEEELPGRTLVVRPGLIVGPHDPTDRFTYWPERVAAGGEVLCPDSPDRVTQFIDARDLASWILDAVATGRTGRFNATGPAAPLRYGRLLEACRDVSGSDATFTWVTEEFLLAEQVGPWMELPLWVPRSPESAGFDAVSIDRAVAAGLRFRPVEETLRDTLAWIATLPADRSRRAGLDREKERELLRKWKERT